MASEEILLERCAQVACITLNRPRALNALSLNMIRRMTEALRAWEADPSVMAVALRGMGKEAAFANFCAGGDIRFFHGAALSGNPALEDFFTEEYALNHLLHRYPKPVLAYLDGVVMGGGMGLAQGASLRLVTERTVMAMPETAIGLFPDVGGGYFLSRCPGHVGEFLGLSGTSFAAPSALAWGLADRAVPAQDMPSLWAAMAQLRADDPAHWLRLWSAQLPQAAGPATAPELAGLDACFAAANVPTIMQNLAASEEPWAQACLDQMRQRSPLMLHVTLEQIRRARTMALADELRMERDMVRHCFYSAHLERSGVQTETAEGIRALAVDKDHTPHWSPAHAEGVSPDMVAPFFDSPWPAHAHPLRGLCD